jgi:hypothetical protein
MADGVSLEVSGSGASSADIQANFDAEAREAEGKNVPEADRVKAAAQELGRKGGEAAARARLKATDAAEDAPAAPAKPKATEPAPKAPEPPGEGLEGKDEALGNPRHNAQARIQQLARERNEERARATALEERLARLEADRAPKPEPRATDAAPGDGKPTPDQYETYEAYVEALTEHKMEARIKKMAAEDTQRRQTEEHTRGVVARVEKFNERLAAVPDLVKRADPRLLDLKPTFMLPPHEAPGPGNALADEIVSSEVAPALIEYLSQHEAEVRRILAMPNAREITRAVTQIEARLSGSPGPAPQPEPLRLAVSQAKPPVRPLAGSSVAGEDDIDGEEDFDRYAARANARDRSRRSAR